MLHMLVIVLGPETANDTAAYKVGCRARSLPRYRLISLRTNIDIWPTHEHPFALPKDLIKYLMECACPALKRLKASGWGVCFLVWIV